MIKRIKSFLFENKTTKQTVAKNTFWLITGSFGAKLLKSVIIIYAARVLGADGYGVFSYALSFAAFFTIFTDLGIGAVISREASKDLNVQQKYFSTGFAIKTILTLLLASLIIILSPILIKQDSVKALLPIIIILVAFDGFRDFAASLCRAWEKMEIDAFIQIFTNIAIIVGGFIALQIAATPKSLSIGYTIGVAIGMVVAFYPYKHYVYGIKKTFSKNLMRPILYASLPLGISGLIGAAMLNTDTIMIGWFRDMSNVGYYSAGQRIIQLVYLIPGVIAGSFFPLLSKTASQKEKFTAITRKSLLLLSLLSIPLTVGSILLSKEIVIFLFGKEYISSIPSFAIMSATYITTFTAAILVDSIFALNKEKNLLTYSILGFVGNFAFNLAFIPKYGIAGSSMSTVITQIITVGYLFYVLKEIKLNFFTKLNKIFIATAAMGIFILATKYFNINVLITITLSVIVYILALNLLKEETFIEIKEMFFRKISVK